MILVWRMQMWKSWIEILTMSLSHINATNAAIHLPVQVIWRLIWNSTMEAQAGQLEKHLKMHSGEKSNKCSQCDFTCSQPFNLRRVLKMHSEKKSNKCNQCDYASYQEGNLRRHLKTHSGEKPNKCNQCGFASFLAGNLRRHLKTHSGNSLWYMFLRTSL